MFQSFSGSLWDTRKKHALLTFAAACSRASAVASARARADGVFGLTDALEGGRSAGLGGAPWLRRLGGILIAGNTTGLINEIYRSLRTPKRCDERPMWEKNSDFALFYY